MFGIVNGQEINGESAGLEHVAASTASTVFGTHALAIHCGAASTGPVTWYGVPFAFAYTPPKIHRTVLAASTHSTQFSKHSVMLGGVTVDAASTAPSTMFGKPTAGPAHQAGSATPATMHGQHSAVITVYAKGSRSTAYGTPTAGRALYAQSVGQGTRWGVPTAVPYFEHIAESVLTGAQFGTPSIGQAFRANSVAPTSRFGKPLVQRGNLC